MQINNTIRVTLNLQCLLWFRNRFADKLSLCSRIFLYQYTIIITYYDLWLLLLCMIIKLYLSLTENMKLIKLIVFLSIVINNSFNILQTYPIWSILVSIFAHFLLLISKKSDATWDFIKFVFIFVLFTFPFHQMSV